MSLPDLPKHERDLVIALRMSNDPRERVRTEALCYQLLVRTGPLTPEFKSLILRELESARLFSLVEPMAERLMREGVAASEVMKSYAQALVETERTTFGEWIVRHALTGIDPWAPEAADWTAMLGRIYKDRFVRLFKQRAKLAEAQDALQQAINWYSTANTPYHAVNLLALACRARKEGWPFPGRPIEIEALAKQLLENVSSKTPKEKWDSAIALEAGLALKQLKEGEGVLEGKSTLLDQQDKDLQGLLYDFCGRADVFAFELGALMRQLRDVWGIDERKSDLIRILQQTAFVRQGSSLDLSSETLKLWAKTEDHLGHRSLQWLETASARGKSVGMIFLDSPRGTGFLARGSDLYQRWGDRPVFLTSGHLGKDAESGRLKVVFHGADPNRSYELGERLYYSPQDELDVAVFAFKTQPQGVAYTPISKYRPDPENSKVLYIVGHQDTNTPGISVYSNVIVDSGKVRVSYTTATTPGAAGSPVFNENWEAVAIHGGQDNAYDLNGLRYSALEGLILEAIVDMAQLESGRH